MRRLLFNLLILQLLHISSYCQNNNYTNREDFSNACTSCNEHYESFETIPNSQKVNSLFSGFVTFEDSVPTIFASSGWQYNCDGNEVTSKALIPEPRFEGNSLIMNFDKPVLGIGASVYDDHDGTPLVNTIKLSLITTKGDTLVIKEDCQSIGDAGFLGGTSDDGITKAIWSIDNNDGNLEIDSLTICSNEDIIANHHNIINELKQKVKLYPNPANNKLFIQSEDFDFQIEKVKIYSITGELIMIKNIESNKFIEIELSSIPEGTYIIQISPFDTKENVITKKFIKME